MRMKIVELVSPPTDERARVDVIILSPDKLHS
jgi:proline racemase